MKIPAFVRGGLWIFALVTLALLYGPPLITAVLSFFRRKAGKVDWEDPTLGWYLKLFANQDLQAALSNSLVVGLAATVFAVLLGAIFALYYWDKRNWLRTALQSLIYFPFVLPPIITGLALLIFFRESGIERSLITVTIGHTLFVLALVYRIVLTRLEALESELTEASLDLGATRFQTFCYVIFPSLRSALIAAAILSFALSFDETLISLFLIGSQNTVPIRLWGMMRVGFTPEVNAMVTLILLFSTTLFIVVARALRRIA